MSYEIPLTGTYRFPAVTLSSAATIGRLTGPKGRKGVVRDISHVTTTNTTVAATVVSVGVTGTLGKFSTVSIPIESANATGNGGTMVAEIEADADILVSTDGGCTAGAADITVMIDWL